MIVDELVHMAVPCDELTLYPGNPRQGDVDAIARSLEAFGQRKPIVATEDGTVVAGNHTLLAARALGWERIAVVRVSDDPTTAAAYALADNRTAELGHYDPMALATMIRDVEASDATLLAAISYSADDIDDLLAQIEEATPLIEHHQPATRYGGGEDEGSYVEPSLEDRLEQYQGKAVRSIVLDFPLDTYEQLAADCAVLRDRLGLASTAELFLALVGEAL